MTDGLAGTVLGQTWRIDEAIGKGGMASVHAGVHLRNGLRVAIKLLHPELTTNDVVTARFLREGYLANRVDHPGVVRVLDDGSTDGHVYLVMELLRGKTLKDLWVERGRAMPAKEVETVVRGVLEILRVAHAAGVVHRDLKPDNIFCTDVGPVKLLDFGIARIREEASIAAHATATGTTLGTPAFMPPEQALGRWEQVDGRADLFGLAATAWMLLTGKLVHDATTLPELLVAAATKAVRPIRTVAPSVPPHLAAVLDRALAFSRDDRWPDAAAMLRALDAPTAGPTKLLDDGADRAPTVSLAAVVDLRQRPDRASTPSLPLQASLPSHPSLPSSPSQSGGSSRLRDLPSGMTGPDDAATGEATKLHAVARTPDQAVAGVPRNRARTTRLEGPDAEELTHDGPPTGDDGVAARTVKLDVAAYRSAPGRPVPTLVDRTPASLVNQTLDSASLRSSELGGRVFDGHTQSTQGAVAPNVRRGAGMRPTVPMIVGLVVAGVFAVAVAVFVVVRDPDSTPVPADAPSASAAHSPTSTEPTPELTASGPKAAPAVTPSAAPSEAAPASCAPSASAAPAASSTAPAGPAFVTRRVCGNEVDFNGNKVCHDVRVPAPRR